MKSLTLSVINYCNAHLAGMCKFLSRNDFSSDVLLQETESAYHYLGVAHPEGHATRV